MLTIHILILNYTNGYTCTDFGAVPVINVINVRISYLLSMLTIHVLNYTNGYTCIDFSTRRPNLTFELNITTSHFDYAHSCYYK